MPLSIAPVAVDALGGDDAPGAIVAGAVAAARAGHGIILVGPTGPLEAALGAAGAVGDIRIEHADEAVRMDEPPVAGLRRKPRASIRVAAELVAAGRACGVYSAGHTGAALVAARGALGLVAGVERPALAVTVPTRRGASLLIDAGANVDCRPEHLAQFGVMGAAFAAVGLGLDAPRVGLLSIGEEAGKGNDVTKAAFGLLMAAPLRFVGNIDAAQWFSGEADVVVADGFVGNIALKVGEAVVEMVAADLPGDVRRRLHYAETGGAPLVGVNGVAVIGHGRSPAEAIANGIAYTARLAAGGAVAAVAEAVGRMLK